MPLHMEDAMSENEPAETVTTDPGEELGEKGVAALKAEREARKTAEEARKSAEKALNELTARVKEFEDRDKTDTEKLAEQARSAMERAQKAERENARLAVIATHQIPSEYHDLIHGDDEESLTASAAKVQALLTSTAPKDRATLVIPDEGGHPNHALNGDGIESALKSALGIR